MRKVLVPKAVPAAVTTLSKKISKGSQSVYFTETLAVVLASGRRVVLRVSIRSDSYKSQSSACIEGFDQEKLAWHGVAELHSGVMETPAGLIYQQDGMHPGHYVFDRDELLDQALAILQHVDAGLSLAVVASAKEA